MLKGRTAGGAGWTEGQPKHRGSKISPKKRTVPQRARTISAKQPRVGAVPEFSLVLVSATDAAIHVQWPTPGKLGVGSIRHIQVQWSSATCPKVKQTILPPRETGYVIGHCQAGVVYYVRVLLVGGLLEKAVVCKSRQLTVETVGPPDPPVVRVRSCMFYGITVEWSRPRTYGASELCGYDVYIDREFVAKFQPHQHWYMYRLGNPCQQYAFQVQAISKQGDQEFYSSRSAPVKAIWPGVKAPEVTRAPADRTRAIGVRWDDPELTAVGVKVTGFKVFCEEDTPDENRQQLVQGPLPPSIRHTMFTELKAGASYTIYVEILVEGLPNPVRCKPIREVPAQVPPAPHLRLSVIGQRERQKIENIIFELVNRKNSLQKSVQYQQSLQSHKKPSKEPELERLQSSKKELEKMIYRCFKSLPQYTGVVNLTLEWEVTDTIDAVVRGYIVQVNGEQYGTVLHEGVTKLDIQLDLERRFHSVQLLTVTHYPEDTRQSSTLQVCTEDFLPFAVFCFHHVHKQLARWPDKGCCYYGDSLPEEQQSAPPVNQWLLGRCTPPPACTVYDVMTEGCAPLVTRRQIPRPDVILFWTSWCVASKRVMPFFVDYARENTLRCAFTACCCGTASGHDHMTKLQDLILDRCWRNDVTVRHCCCCQATRVQLERDTPVQRGAMLQRLSSNVPQLFGVPGVPTMVVISADGYLAWRGQICAIDYPSFKATMDEVVEKVLSRRPAPAGYSSVGHSLALGRPSRPRTMSAVSKTSSSQHSTMSEPTMSRLPQTGRAGNINRHSAPILRLRERMKMLKLRESQPAEDRNAWDGEEPLLLKPVAPIIVEPNRITPPSTIIVTPPTPERKRVAGFKSQNSSGPTFVLWRRRDPRAASQ
ncbi:uncharacterized protein LOC144873248 [Branchiostoma floridae x Branchiostoma japonicum]